MVFSSTLFIFIFLPITLIGYYVFRGNTKNYYLLLMSLIFFSWSQPNYVWIILANILINYICALLIDRLESQRKLILILSIVGNLGLLFYFKYFDFALKTFSMIIRKDIEPIGIILPIGISFFTFQGLSYVVDVYRGDVPAQKNISKVALYIVLFPQLIAGPIVRYTDIAAEIDSRKETLDDFVNGIERFIIGLGKKALIANSMAACADAIWANDVCTNSCLTAWIGSIAYTLQIFFDFSGYSDMAIGLGRMFGFHFNENFNLPYVSKSITEFWRRWHISLSSWFRDYVYIPLGGNRKHVYLNLAIVFLLTGIWHGASWHFIFWGIWNGLFILVERVIRKRRTLKNKDDKPSKQINTNIIKDIVSSIYTLLIVNIGWVIFRAERTSDAFKYLCIMFGIIKPSNVGFTTGWYLDKWTIAMLLIGIFFSSILPTKISEFIHSHVSDNKYDVLKYISLLLVFILAILRIVSGTYNPFIYFQF